MFSVQCSVFVVVLSFLLRFGIGAHAGEVYQSVFAELTRHEHRLPGSEAYASCLDHLEKTLKDAGLEPHRQTYDTLVPDTRECRLTVEGIDVAPVYALGPNGAANSMTGGRTLTGPLVYLGKGSLTEMDGKPVEGSIALLDFDSPNMIQVFSQGALAIVFVGDGSETQWQVRRQFTEIDAELPRLFMHRKDAERHGLLSGEAARSAEVKLTTVWKDVEAANLWVEIPGEPGAMFNFDQEEAIVLGATFDTFGTVPGQSPAVRAAANCALLAEVAAGLKGQPRKRSVFVVFFGSHYAMLDGARMFYFAVRRGRGGGLKTRAAGYTERQADARELLAVLENDDLFGDKSSYAKEVKVRIEKRLTARVSELNYELRLTRDQLLPLRRMKTPLPADEAAKADLEAEEERIQEMRRGLNGMRRQLNDEVITNAVLFADIAAEERAAIKREVRDVDNLSKHNTTHRELAARISDKRIVGHYDFNFANATGEWVLDMESAGEQMFYHSVNLKFAKVKMGDYIKNYRTIADVDASLDGAGAPGAGLFSDPASSLVLPGRFCTPSVRCAPMRVAHAIQAYGYQLQTLAEPLNGDELPYRQEVDLEPLVPRLVAFAGGLATYPALSQVCALAEPQRHRDAVMHFEGDGGLRFLTYARGSVEQLAGVPEDSIAFCAPNGAPQAPVVAGHSYSAASRVRASGHIFMPVLYYHVKFRPLGFRPDGALQYFPEGGGNRRWAHTRMIHGTGGVMNAPYCPGEFADAGRRSEVFGTLASGKSDAGFGKGVYSDTANDSYAFYTLDGDPFMFWLKGGLLLLGSTEADPMGKGVSVDDVPLYSFNVLRQCAHDYLLLNDSRLQILRDRSIVNDSLESLHADADEHWGEAAAARKENNISEAVAHEAFSAGISAKVAPALREVTNDMVRAVVLLLVLTLPFAFVMERLFISATSIYRQVLGFVAFFVGSFVLLYMVHPAFQIASSPLIIFLAFVIILLSGLVISIVMSKFKKELRTMQGLSTSAHGVASDSSTALAAVLIGISGMRNRPLKTFLTGLTIVLLTFAIVVFASFSPVVGVKKEYYGKGDGPNRIELHRFTGLALPPMLHQALASLYSRDWSTFAREAFFRAPMTEVEGSVLIAFNPSNHKWQKLESMAAFDPGEMAHNKVLAAAIPGFGDYRGEQPPLFLSPRMAKTMELEVGDTVTIGGKVFAFAGSFDAGALDQFEYMDRSLLMPPDFESSQSELMRNAADAAGQSALTKDESVDTTRFTYCSARSVGITVLGELSELDRPELLTRLNAIVMYAGEGADVAETAERIAAMFTGPVMAKGASGVNQFFFSTSMQASGFSVVIVPLLLGGLIIFNSLLGSIVEREKEIFTYSAMGLSPPSVGALFFAESGVYAILGGMGGYLFSQLVAKLVAAGGEMGWFVPPELNFSSLSSVLTSFVVMAVVMISTIYPAIKAGRSANPGVARKWKMPAPVDGRIDFVFPFTVSANDMGGILAYIGEHFENHGDAAIGSFATTDVALFKADEEDNLGIRANISLAPFDLGVMQEFKMYARPSEIEGIDEIVVHLNKVSGTEGAWLRGNRVFVNELREQFLLWRSLPVSTVMHYRELGEDVP